MVSKECALAGSKRIKQEEKRPCSYIYMVAARKCTPLRGEQQATFYERLRCKDM